MDSATSAVRVHRSQVGECCFDCVLFPGGEQTKLTGPYSSNLARCATPTRGTTQHFYRDNGASPSLDPLVPAMSKQAVPTFVYTDVDHETPSESGTEVQTKQ